MDVIENPQRTSMELRRGSDTLVVIFCSWVFEPGRYEFYKMVMGRGFDCIWLSDLDRRYFMAGATDIAADAEALRDWLLEKSAPYRRIVCIGTSMGGSGSLLFGAEIGADLTINFGPQTCLRTHAGLDQMLTLAIWKSMYEDMEELYRADPSGPLGRRTDVCKFVAALPDPPVPHLVTIPTVDIRDHYDAWRIQNLIGSARVFEVENDSHPGARRLIEAGIMGDWFDCFDRPAPVADAVFRIADRYLHEYRAPESALRRELRRFRHRNRRRRALKAALSDGLQRREARKNPRDA